MEQESPVSASAKQGTDAAVGERRELRWTEASIWTDRMVSALANGVKGGKWFSLIDKVWRPSTLEAAWQRVARNKGAAGVDGQSVARFFQDRKSTRLNSSHIPLSRMPSSA